MTEARVSPLRSRMIEEMNVRHFWANAQHDYILAIFKFAFLLAYSRIPRAMRPFAVSSFRCKAGIRCGSSTPCSRCTSVFDASAVNPSQKAHVSPAYPQARNT